MNIDNSSINNSDVNNSEFNRRYPPQSLADTRNKVGNNRINLFHDKDIRSVSKIVKGKVVSGVQMHKSQNRKWIIPQQSTRGCTSAATAMLIENKENIDQLALSRRNLGNAKTMIRELKEAQKVPKCTKVKDLMALKKVIDQFGSTIVPLNDEDIGGHVVVVDKINDDESVLLRDPYHGWEITVNGPAFSSRLSAINEVIFLKKNQQ